jgi:hypothetical protein
LRSHPAQVECAPEEPAEGAPPPPPPRETDGEEPTAGSACNADAQHCCQPDGTIVRPGGCQPSYRTGDVPNIHRGPDGFCVRDDEPCLVRCLPAEARIATPSGEVPVHSLHVGDAIYTESADGARVASRVARVGAVELAGRHHVVEVRLSDGRRVRGSAPHPIHDGRAMGGLAVGDQVDGATVVGVEARSYDGSHTHDVLPEGSTGVYWADGVRLRSTLSP